MSAQGYYGGGQPQYGYPQQPQPAYRALLQCNTSKDLLHSSTSRHHHHDAEEAIADVWELVLRPCAVASCARRVVNAAPTAASAAWTAARTPPIEANEHGRKERFDGRKMTISQERTTRPRPE